MSEPIFTHQAALLGLKLLLKLLEKKLSSSSKEVRNLDTQNVLNAIEEHTREVVNWAGNIQFFELGRPKATGKITIPLNLEAAPRRFKSTLTPARTMKETAFLKEKHSGLLLGEPGSGKTTTLKRLARMILLKKPISQHDIFQYPIVIRLRELGQEELLGS